MSNDQEKGSHAEEDLAQLRQEVQQLRAQVGAGRTAHATERGRRVRSGGVEAAHRHVRRNPTVVLAPGIVATTVPGSIYSTSLSVLANMGKLALHDALFKAFSDNPTPQSARRLLDELGVFYKELEQMVRGDVRFKEHCVERTQQLKNRASRGNRKAAKVLANPDICSRGRWKGDLREAVNILHGGSTPFQWQRGRNQQILRKAGVMFATSQRDGEPVCFLYKRVHHPLFRRARELAGE